MKVITTNADVKMLLRKKYRFMAFYQFKSKSLIKADISEVWDFISSPLNLKKITPEYMGFVVTNKMAEQKMYPGMIITY